MDEELTDYDGADDLSRGVDGTGLNVESDEGPAEQGEKKEDVVKLHITENLDSEEKGGDEDGDNMGVDIEAQFDPREWMRKGLFRVVDGLDIVEDDDYDHNFWLVGE